MSSREKDEAIEIVNDWLSHNGTTYDDVQKDDKGYYIIQDFTQKVYLPDKIQEVYVQF